MFVEIYGLWPGQETWSPGILRAGREEAFKGRKRGQVKLLVLIIARVRAITDEYWTKHNRLQVPASSGNSWNFRRLSVISNVRYNRVRYNEVLLYITSRNVTFVRSADLFDNWQDHFRLRNYFHQPCVKASKMWYVDIVLNIISCDLSMASNEIFWNSFSW
jgi:hypothetical protein